MRKSVWIAAVLIAAGVAAATQAPAVLGRIELDQAKRAMAKGDIARAAELSARAARHAPSPEATDFARLYQAYNLLMQHKDAEALPILESVHGRFRDDALYSGILVNTRANVAFDRRDFDAFLHNTLEMEKRRPADRAAVTFVASAYSCKWAVTGDDQWKQKAEAQLAKAEQLPPDKSAERMVRRIRHRFQTKTILTDAEYDQIFND